jgi:hypothetical protein
VFLIPLFTVGVYRLVTRSSAERPTTQRMNMS